jgi:hypothetical protein
MSIGCISMFLFVNNLSAQTTWEEWIQQLVENEDQDSYTLETLIEDLTELKEHPISIHTATREQLKRIPFLSNSERGFMPCAPLR